MSSHIEIYMNESAAWPYKLPFEYIRRVFEKAQVKRKRELDEYFKETTLSTNEEASLGTDETETIDMASGPDIEQSGVVFEPNPSTPTLEH